MDTTQIGPQEVAAAAGRRWRRHAAEFKARVIELAKQPGTSMAAVALANGLNANMLRRRVHEAAAGGGASKVAATSVARVVGVFGAAHPNHAYLFASRRANRMKVLVHDGIGVWLAARRRDRHAAADPPSARCPGAGLPWQRLGDAGIIRVI